ncbi:MAG: RNA polymerase sigma factor [Gemmatimonadales bacterium]
MTGTPVDLIGAIRNGSPEALATAYERHALDVLRVAYRITGNRADAEDVLQDVFVGLPRALQRYRESGRFGAWLKQVAARTALMRLRRLRRETALSEFAEPIAGSGADLVVDRVAAAAVLDRMPPGLRRVFLLKEVDGYSHREVATLLGISIPASEVRLHRAWQFIQRATGTR